MLLKSLRIISHQLFYFVAIVTILLLLGLLGAMWVSEEISERKDELAQWVGEQIGHQVKVGSAGLYLLDLVPKLEVSEIVVEADSDTPLLSLDRAYLGLDILTSIERQVPVIESVELNGLELSVQRDAEGIISIEGLQASQQVDSSGVQHLKNVSTWLSDIQLSQVRVNYRDAQSPHFSDTYVIHKADIDALSNKWTIKASMGAETLWPRLTDVTAQVVLADNTLAVESWQMSAQVEAVPLISMLANTTLYDAALTSGTLTANVDITHRGNHNKAQLSFSLDNVELRSTTDTDKTALLSHLAGDFMWHQSGQTWTLDTDALEVQFNEAAWPVSPLHLSSRSGFENVTLATDYLNLTDISTFLSVFAELPVPIDKVQPVGVVENLRLQYADEILVSLTAQGSELGAFPYQSLPGFNNLNVKIALQAQQGAVVFDTHQATVFAPEWLDEGVNIDTASGAVSWRWQDDNWHVFTQDLRLLNEHMDVTLNGRVNRQNQATDSDLNIVIDDFEVSQWQHYVPASIRPEHFSRWSQRAFKAGRLTKGKIEVKGELAAFPFDKQPTKGTFIWQALVEQANLQYADDWPEISELTASLNGFGNQLRIDSSSGKIAGFDFDKVNVAIPNLVRSDPILKLNGHILGTTDLAFDFLANSPLKSRFGSLTEWVKATGDSDIQLDLMVPLVRVEDTEVSGSVGFENSQLSVNDLPEVTIDAIQGRLAFSNDGVSVEAMKGRAFNQPVSIRVIPEEKRTRVAMTGQAAITELRQRWPNLFPYSFVSGEAGYTTQLFIEEPERGQFDIRLAVDSNLVGVTIDAPLPLGKQAEDKRDLSLNINLETPLVYQLDYHEWISAAFSNEEAKLLGEVRIGGQTAAYKAQPLSVFGNMSELDADIWLDWQRQFDGSEDGLGDTVTKVVLDVDRMTLSGQTLDKVKLEARPYQTGWMYDLNSWQIAGSVQVPDAPSNAQPVQANLLRCYLAMPKVSSEQAAPKDTPLWPAIDLIISDFAIDNTQLGLLTLKARQQGSRWQIETANILSPAITAEFSGHWLKDNQTSSSEFSLLAESTNLNELLSYYDYQEVAEAESVTLEGNLSWSGSPADFSLRTLKGQLGMKVGKGRLIEVEPGAAGRIFGLLSITALPRRLALDFSDFFGKGFGFSTIQGRFEFNNGLATTDNLIMKGDSADIAIAGPVDLVNKTYNQTVKVTPKVSSTLPLAGAVAGGPVGLGVGAAILLVDKIAGKIFDREIVNMITYNYVLTGPWADPELKVKSATQVESEPEL